MLGCQSERLQKLSEEDLVLCLWIQATQKLVNDRASLVQGFLVDSTVLSEQLTEQELYDHRQNLLSVRLGESRNALLRFLLGFVGVIVNFNIRVLVDVAHCLAAEVYYRDHIYKPSIVHKTLEQFLVLWELDCFVVKVFTLRNFFQTGQKCFLELVISRFYKVHPVVDQHHRLCIRQLGVARGLAQQLAESPKFQMTDSLSIFEFLRIGHIGSDYCLLKPWQDLQPAS